MKKKDTYKTITKTTEEVLFKDKNSKFFGYAFMVTNEIEIKSHLEQLKKQHYAARHWCYAWQIGTEQFRYRANDDGEPSNSAGQPIYGQIQSFELTNILIVVVRYFGGVKLGVGGLINAYRTAAKLALENAEIIEKTIDIQYQIIFEYKDMNKVMRIIKEQNLRIVNQKMELNCLIKIAVRKSSATRINDILSQIHEIKVKQI